jgi:AcrR family transcriptional regulator
MGLSHLLRPTVSEKYSQNKKCQVLERIQMDALVQPANKSRNFEAKIQALLAAQAKRQDDDMRKKLICASELMEWLEAGFNEANVTRVADKAGVSTATLYRLYPDRNQLFLDALKLGNQLLLDLVLDAPQHPHPFRNLIEFTYHLTSIWQQASVQMFYFIQGFILQTETEITAEARVIAAGVSQEFRNFVDAILDRLVADGFVENRDRQIMFVRLAGEISVRTRSWHGDLGMPYKPAMGWYEEAIKVVEEFFFLYGTAKFRSVRQQSPIGFLDGGSLQKTPVEEINKAKFYATLERDLPFLKDIETSLREKPTPASAHELLMLELQRMLTKSPNRLDATNRRGRIVASAAIVIYTQGFQKLSMASIAKQAGVSTATLYRLYPTNWDLYQAAYGLGVSIYMAWLERDIQAANPLVEFTNYAAVFFEVFFDVQSKNAWSLDQLRGEPSEIEQMQRYSEIKVQLEGLVWQKRFSKLYAEGYIKELPSWDMIHTFQGPTSISIILYMRDGLAPLPKSAWFEESWRITDEFFQIYGTPHFHAMRKQMNWDADLEAHSGKFP